MTEPTSTFAEHSDVGFLWITTPTHLLSGHGLRMEFQPDVGTSILLPKAA